MSDSRKDYKGRVLRKGESQRSSDNRYIYQYTDPNGDRHVIYARELTELREKEKILAKDQMDGVDSYSAGKTTLNIAFDRYIVTKYNLKESTRVGYKYWYDHCVRDSFGKRRMCDIKYSDVKCFYYSLMEKGHLKPLSVDNVHTVLHPAFQMAVRDGIIRNNPTEGVMAEIKRNFKNKTGIRHALTIEQQKTFLSYMSDNPVFYHWTPLFTVLLGTGCRIGEAAGLRWEDIDYEKRQISINHTLTYRKMDDGRCRFWINTPKTEAGKRIIPMLDVVYKAFKDEYERQEEEGFNDDCIDGMSGFIFENKDRHVIHQETVNKAIRRIVENCNSNEISTANTEKRKPVILPQFSCHHLRHTFCTRLCECETNIKVIQSIMGHADITTTMNIYADVSTAKNQDAMMQIEHNYNIF